MRTQSNGEFRCRCCQLPSCHADVRCSLQGGLERCLRYWICVQIVLYVHLEALASTHGNWQDTVHKLQARRTHRYWLRHRSGGTHRDAVHPQRPCCSSCSRRRSWHFNMKRPSMSVDATFDSFEYVCPIPTEDKRRSCCTRP